MQFNEGIGGIPMPTGFRITIYYQHRGVRFGENNIGKCHSNGAAANDDVICL